MKKLTSQRPAAVPISDRATLTDVIADVMQATCPSYSVDVLLTHPDEAKAMAREVCRRMARKATANEIHEVLRAAIAARKRGDLKRDRA